MIVSVGGRNVAGSSDITYDGVQKAAADIVGVSGNSRTSSWSYDERSRLKTTSIAREKSPVPATEVVTKSDFRTALERTPETPASAKSISFSELSGGGHKIASVAKGSDTRAFDWKGGAERVDDGNFVYEYDATGRLIKATEKPRTGTSNLSQRRVKYFYDGRERLVGRRAEYANVSSAGVTPLETDWKVEDRADVIASDAIPPDVTLFWDSVSDNLVAVFRAGSSNGAPGGGAIDANGGLVRQIIHGSLEYDDPLEVAVADPAVITPNSGAVIPSVARKVGGSAARESMASTSTITHLYPVYDEAAAGSLQAIINTTGEIVSRNFAEGAYGEDEYALGGAAVDRIAVHATKDDQGNVTSVDVTLRTTEALKSSTLTAGLRLAAVTKDGEVVRSANAVPTLFDNNDATAVWKLTPAEWNALVDPAPVTVGTATLTPAALSIAATSELRAESWGDVPVLPAPDWALQSKPLFTSAALPFELRESLANLSSWLSSIPAKSDRTQPLYEVDDLSALGRARTFGGSGRESAGDPAQLLLGAAFHAQPFSELLTGKNYVRARWYDPATGTWLTPDPLGYHDSSNMYAFAGGDPVNGRDPFGLGDGYLGGLITKNFSLNPDILNRAEAWVTEKIESIENRQVREFAQSLQDLPETVTTAVVYRANPTVGGTAVAAGTINCINQRTLAAQSANPRHFLAAVNDCTGISDIFLKPFGRDGYGDRISKQEQADAQGRGVAVAVHIGVFIGVGTSKPDVPQGKSEPASGNTVSTSRGTSHHAVRAASRRESGMFSTVNEALRDADGNSIKVPRSVDLKTGMPVESKGVQVIKPDATIDNVLTIIDDKPLNRNVLVKDRQEMIRNITGYQAKTGKMPRRIAIERYDPSTGNLVRTDFYDPADFLPGSRAKQR